MPLAKNQSVTRRRSALRDPTTFCALICSPPRAGAWQSITLGTPSTRARQPSQPPRKQLGPRGRWSLGLRATMDLSAARSAARSGSPRSAVRASASMWLVTGSASARLMRTMRRDGTTDPQQQPDARRPLVDGGNRLGSGRMRLGILVPANDDLIGLARAAQFLL